VLYDCWAYTNLGTLGCTSRDLNESMGVPGGEGNPLAVGGQHGWNVQIVSQTDTSATLRIWNGLYTVNAASFAAGNPMSAGSLAAIYGDFLAPRVEAAQSMPLPASLAGVSVTVNGVAAPLHFVSPGQINMQIPYETAPGPATVVVTNNGIPAMTGRLQIAPAAPGSDLSLPVGSVTATIGGQAATVEWAGMTPQCAGIVQFHIRVPNLAAGSYPLVISIDGRASNNPLITVGRP
jgi:hypothetical protein